MAETRNGARLVTFSAGTCCWIILGGTVPAVGAMGVVSTISHYFSLSISTEIQSQRVVKGKTTTTTLIYFGYRLTKLKLPVKDDKQCWS